MNDVRVGKDRLLGVTEERPYREGVKEAFTVERTGVAAMALGIIERCLELSIEYAKNRGQFGQPIASHQLIQEKIAKMEVHRLNVTNLVFRVLSMAADGRHMSLTEASASKLYAARAATETALEAVQLFGGNGYMAEFEVEQLARECHAQTAELGRARATAAVRAASMPPTPTPGTVTAGPALSRSAT